MSLLAFRPAKGRWLSRLSAAASAVQRVGITTRMILSFAAVALLAGTANMIARESVHIIRTVTHAPEFQALPRPLPAGPRIVVADDPRWDSLRDGIASFRDRVRQRVENDTSSTASAYLEAKRTLQLAIVALKRDAAEPANDVAKRSSGYLEGAKELILLSDQRRQARSVYANHVRAADERIRESLQGAWSVFGRVIARKSLLQLRDELDAVKMRADGLLAGETLDPEEASRLITAEATLEETLTSNRLSLSKSEGAAWFTAEAADFAALVKTREFLRESNGRLVELQHKFQDVGSILENSARSQAEVAKRASVIPEKAPVVTTLPAADAVIETTLERNDPAAAKTMALVTALVMLVIIAISVFTVRSIVIPVRRLVRATRQLADAHTRVRVGRGGIKELDAVAQAFDQMAEQLETMRSDYRKQQEGLEHQVVERTYKLQRLAHQDPLTSLPNRRHLSSLLSAALSRAQDSGRLVGVFFLDIDNFKNINDSLGHVFGDRVLMSVANRLEEVMDGVGFVARLGGDEFTLVYESALSIRQLQDFGLVLTAAFDKSVSVDDRQISIRVSIGVSAFPEHGAEPEALLRAADSALFRAKDLGRNQLAIFTPELITTAATRFTLEQGLRSALARDEFELAYQPEIDLSCGEVGSVEALLRWRQPDGRLAMPGEFLSVAEQSGLMPEINTWVLEAAFKDAACWYHGGWPEARVAINISARQLVDRLFVEHILGLLEKWQLPAKCIELELTESVLQTGATTIAALRALRSHGFGIALDDFGTGYSSLTSLEQLPLSRVKLDATLVGGIGSSPRATAIAQAIIDLCAGLGLEVTAEGIERPEQYAWFARNSGICLQGFLFSHALPFSRVLPFKAGLGNRLNDLFLSLPAPAGPTPPENGVSPRARPLTVTSQD